MTKAIEEVFTCAVCNEPEGHMNHHADYSLDGSWWHPKDHDFVPTECKVAK